MIAPPGMPNMTSTPDLMRPSQMICAPVLTSDMSIPALVTENKKGLLSVREGPRSDTRRMLFATGSCARALSPWRYYAKKSKGNAYEHELRATVHFFFHESMLRRSSG